MKWKNINAAVLSTFFVMVNEAKAQEETGT